jgi:hypothetical protein
MEKKKLGKEINALTPYISITEENSKENEGKEFIFSVNEIVDAEKRIVSLITEDGEIIRTYLPTVVFNFIKTNPAYIGGKPLGIKYMGLKKFKDGKKHFGKSEFHGYKMYDVE